MKKSILILVAILWGLVPWSAGAQTSVSPVQTFTCGAGNFASALASAGTFTCTSAGVPAAANPTATIGTSAVNGSASTYMRSDAAPAAPQASSSTFGLMKVDNTTQTASSGVVSTAATTINGVTCTPGGSCTITAAAGSVTVGSTTIGSGTNTKVLYDNSGTLGEYTVSGTGDVAMTTNGVFTTPDLGTPSAISLTNATNLPAVSLQTGTSATFSGNYGIIVCTGTCTITVPVPAAGKQFCAWNDDNISTVITLSAIGSSARYENTARTAYGTAGTGTLVSAGAIGDKVCIVGVDSTHYHTISYLGTWTAN